ncbi:PadR family transcriptional regulator [Microbacterium rhizomatis]|uniref:PadR family transcriptional regulator n=1 Tax=Microbacterium rhizomatis TaxID=1631477 RepID=A0A5J5J3T0_9MICO|nr:PadR family transcriptional regulator [Microbacterium rhizomatis]KAA9110721.1 PadR family transcriptional regulator [Microbacterium rhizomatis]
MSIPKAFLVLLSESPMNGNQLKTAFESRTGSTWPLNIGQAYTTLQRLERDGLVGPLAGGDSELYELTRDGRAAVREWWDSPVERSRPTRDELAIKLTLAVAAPGVDVSLVVQRQRTESMRMLHQYTRLKAQAKQAAAQDLAWQLLLDSLIFQTEAEIRWLDHVEATIVREVSAEKSWPVSAPEHAHHETQEGVSR